MKAENQVISFKTALTLNNFGIKLQSLFIWCNIIHPENSEISEPILYVNGDDFSKLPLTEFTNPKLISIYDSEEEYETDGIYHAYTTSELGKMLKGFNLPYYNNGIGWQIKQLENKYHRPVNEADARGMLLVHLINKKKITVEQINQTL